MKGLCSPDKSPNVLLSNVGGSLFFQCNYNIKYVKLNDDPSNFYTNLISYWKNLNVAVPQPKLDTLFLYKNVVFRAQAEYSFFFCRF